MYQLLTDFSKTTSSFRIVHQLIIFNQNHEIIKLNLSGLSTIQQILNFSTPLDFFQNKKSHSVSLKLYIVYTKVTETYEI